MTPRSAGPGERLETVSADGKPRAARAEQACRPHLLVGGRAAWSSPLRPALVVAQREQLLLHPVPALQAAPQPVGVDHVQLPALLGLAHLLCACRQTQSTQSHGIGGGAPQGRQGRRGEAGAGGRGTEGRGCWGSGLLGFRVGDTEGQGRALQASGTPGPPSRQQAAGGDSPARAAMRWVGRAGSSGSSTSWVRMRAPSARAW